MRSLLFVYLCVFVTVNYAQSVTSTQVSEFRLIGIEVRTNNKKEAAEGGNIPKLWQKFLADNVFERIPNKIDSKIHTLFSDYATDRNGEYTYMIGAKVKNGTAAPEDMVVKTVPRGTYSMLSSDEGPFARVVPQVWGKVWKLEDQGAIRRAYKTDFEVYGSADGQTGRVQLYVSTK